MSLLMSEIIVIDSLNDGLLDSLEAFRGAEYGIRLRLFAGVHSCSPHACEAISLYVAFRQLLSFIIGIATWVATCNNEEIVGSRN